jgi:hypothetical protein
LRRDDQERDSPHRTGAGAAKRAERSAAASKRLRGGEPMRPPPAKESAFHESA